MLSYFAELDTMDFVTARTMGVSSTRLPSAGRFFNSLAVDYVFSTPVSASSSGLSMDIGLIRKLVKAPDGTKDKQIQFMLASGANSSALEHSMPEQLFSTTGNPAQGISAVKALQLANDQGIPVYTINQTNIGNVLPQLQLDGGTISDIQSAVNAGKVVTVSKTNINFNGWTGCGYIIIDPTTGAGAYMISGGVNGAILMFVAAIFVILAVMTSPTVIGAFTFGMLAFIFAFEGISLIYGDAAANEFLNCLLHIGASHSGMHLLLEIFTKSVAHSYHLLFFEIAATYYITEHAINHFGACLEGLYGHLFP